MEVYPRLLQTLKMEHFALPIAVELSIFDVSEGLEKASV